MIEKLLGLATIGGTLTNMALVRRFLSGITIIVALTIISAMMIGMMVIGGLYMGYRELVISGLDPVVAALLVSMLILFITVIMISITLIEIKKLRELTNRAFRGSVPGISRLTGLAEAFISGLCSPRPQRRS